VAPVHDRQYKIPPLIRRNTVLLALAQAFVGTGTQLVPTLTAIMVQQLINSPALFGLGTSLMGVSRLIVAYPIGYISDRFGRRVSLTIGQTLCVLGAVLLSLAMYEASIVIFVLAALTFGLGVGAGQQLRLAAADMYLPKRRGEGLGYVLTGSLIGALGAPLLMTLGTTMADSNGYDPLVLVWLLLPITIVPGMALVWFIRPDPKTIAQNLSRFYPGYVAPPRPPSSTGGESGFRAWASYFPLTSAFTSSFATQGVMSMMMAMTSLALAHHNYALPLISVSVSIHVIGMFGLSVPLGRMVDRLGRRNMMLLGVMISAFGSVLVPNSPDYAVITTGTFLVGLGWSCVNVASSALIADVVGPLERGRAVGTSDAFSQASSIVMPLAAGPLAAVAGLPSLSVLALLVLAAPVLMLVRLRESSPGQFDRAYARATPALSDSLPR
jgi:MFS family permease